MKKKLSFFVVLFSITWGNAQLSCATAMDLSPGTYTAPAVTGTALPTVCTLANSGNAALWYKYTATQNINITVSTALPGQM